MNNSVLCIIVTYNAMTWIDRCLGSLSLSTMPVKALVIDNGSNDGTPEYVRSHFPEVVFLQNKQNLGFGKANNIGLQKALDEGYDYAYLLNQDAWVLPNTIQLLIDTQLKHPEYGILSPMQLQANGEHLDSNFLHHVIREHQTTGTSIKEDLYFNRLKEVYEVEFVMAAHWLISRECIKKTGGFSPTFPHYGEDDNYLQRCQYRGMKAGIVPMARAVHDREERKDSEEKKQYITRYIEALKRASQPQQPIHVDKYIKAYLRGGLLSRDKYMLKYAFRLLRERKDIIENRETSMSTPCAFLKRHD